MESAEFMNELQLMSELKEKAVLSEKLIAENAKLRSVLKNIEFCSWSDTCPECGHDKPKHRSDGTCKVEMILRSVVT